MKTLCIVRHAKSSWDHPELPDYKRPLLEAGILRTQKVVGYLKNQKVNPGLIISSHATRAKETSMIIADGLSYAFDRIKIEEKVYTGNEDDVFNLIFGVSNNVDQLMVIGHNPTLTNLSNYFLAEPLDWLPTSGVVSIEFETDKWENILQAKKRTKFVISPKLIREGKEKK
jgi:phosphohistidine phosphatase